MRVLITGGEGYIGGHLVNSLLQNNHQIVTLDSHFSSKPFECTKSANSHIAQHRASVVNEDAVLRAMQGVDVIYHLAAREDWNTNPKQPMRLTNINVGGTATVLAMARKAGVAKVIFTSSSEVYGNIIPAAETDNCIPVTYFGATKLAAECICRGFYELGVEIVILRLFNVWGGANSQSVVSKFTLDEEAFIYNDGSQTRDFVHITDVIRALRAAIDWDSTICNIGTGQEIVIGGLWEKLREDEKPEHATPKYAELFRSCADISHVKQTTGWEAKVLLSELTKKEVDELCK